jgi:murein DD-endopeptidase MepM/ murein hydrolase activator NlpD
MSYQRSVLRRSVGVLAVLALLIAGMAHAGHWDGVGGQDRQSEIEDERSQLRKKISYANQQITTLADEIALSTNRQRSLEAEIAEINRQLANAQSRIDDANAELAVARAELLRIEQELVTTQAKHDEIEEMAHNRIRNTYKRRTGQYVNIILGADSLRELIIRFKFVQEIMEDDNASLNTLVALADQLDQARLQAAAHKDEITKQLAKIEAEKNRIQSLKRSLDHRRAGVVSEISKQSGLKRTFEQQKAAYIEAMKRLEAESASISAYLRSRQGGQVYNGSSNLAWPMTGRLTSGYGWRENPFDPSKKNFHTGIDIAAPAGRPIVAADAGEVVMAQVRGGYGMMVLIDHGNAMATLYAHMSAFNVSEGDVVGRGTTIGYNGSTGWSTGPHLHFEVRINGDHTDPMRYF